MTNIKTFEEYSNVNEDEFENYWDEQIDKDTKKENLLSIGFDEKSAEEYAEKSFDSLPDKYKKELKSK